jgi:replication factor C subunit 2/4
MIMLIAQVLAKIMEVCKQEGVEYSEDGLEAIVFTAQVRVLKF